MNKKIRGREVRVINIRTKPILHIITRDLETEKHIINEIKKRRKEDSTFLKDYYIFYSYKGECKIEVFK
jgi:hypothetical protein